ncbi:MAG: DoxX family protein [Muribaculaceae bacterium]|jgi:putative oxidoreductase|nr:DoxX family protein [Muribaculaceae bacterium]
MIPKAVKYLFVHGTGHTYSNMSRLFIRLFTGVMFLQFGIRQIAHFSTLSLQSEFAVLGMDSATGLTVMIIIELVCSTLIIFGFLTRLSVIPPLVSMIVAEHVILNSLVDVPASQLISTQPGYLPIMFIGIFIYMLLAGPGKISLDYLISRHYLSMENDRDDESEDALESA